jgi:glycosyltransferase involved in cell wall biosynthesis
LQHANHSPSGRRARLLILTPWYPHPESPISGIFVRDQAEILAQAFDVLVYFLKVVPGRMIVRDMLRGEPPSIRTDHGIQMVSGRYYGMPNTARPLASWLAYKKCRRHIDLALRQWGGKPDIIHAHVASPAGWVAVRMAKRLRVPVVITEHTGPFSALIPRPGARRPVEEALTGAGALLAVSPALAAAMRQEFPGIEPQVLGNVVRTDFFVPSANTGGDVYRFAALALMQPGKGLDVLLQAARKLIDSGCAKFHILIGGDGPERTKLERFVADHRLGEHVKFLGLLSRAEVRSLFQTADIFVLPSLGETFGVAVAEAMACGKPVIATRCGGPEFVVGREDGFLIEPNSADALASAMRAAYKGELKSSGAGIRDSVDRRFGPAVFRAELLRIYGRLLARDAAGAL